MDATFQFRGSNGSVSTGHAGAGPFAVGRSRDWKVAVERMEQRPHPRGICGPGGRGDEISVDAHAVQPRGRRVPNGASANEIALQTWIGLHATAGDYVGGR